jgi:uncharacterized iron-regulated protein
MKQILFSVLFLFGLKQANAQSLPIQPETPFKVYDTKSGKQIGMNDIVGQLNNVDVVFWGEEHNDTVGHILQLKMLKLLHDRYQDRLVFSLEMFERDCQTVLNEYLDGFIPKDRFLKDARPWNTYEQDYAPMIEYAKAERIKVVAANSPRRYNSLMSKRGQMSLDSLSKESKQHFAKLPIYAPKYGRYYTKFIDIMGGEGNVHSPNMFASQCLWDATMAQSIHNALKAGKTETVVFHISGKFHSDEYLGTVSQLSRLNNKVKPFVISCFYAEDYEQPNLEKYGKLGDVIILTKKLNTEN